jgi:hypothetical protein
VPAKTHATIQKIAGAVEFRHSAGAYIPAFFLVEQIRRKGLAKVVRTLGDLTGWSKWKFFTTPIWALDDLTPLQALFSGDRKQVLRAAEEFIKG